MTGLPAGTVAFLFTDIEESTGLWDREPEAMHDAFERYLTLADAAISFARRSCMGKLWL